MHARVATYESCSDDKLGAQLHWRNTTALQTHGVTLFMHTTGLPFLHVLAGGDGHDRPCVRYLNENNSSEAIADIGSEMRLDALGRPSAAWWRSCQSEISKQANDLATSAL